MNFDILDVKNLVDTFDRGPTGDAYLDRRWDAHVAKFGAGLPYWRMFWRLCEAHRPDLCVELGAWQGTCAAHMASGGGGTVVTIDHHSDPGDVENRRLCREASQRYPGLFYIQGWTWEVVGDVMPLGEIDVLFIDSWHDYPHAMKDWEAYRPLLADSALVVFDDLCPTDHPTISGMLRAWDEMSWPYQRFVKDDGISTFPMGFFHYVKG